jgi:hypothetical protein
MIQFFAVSGSDGCSHSDTNCHTNRQPKAHITGCRTNRRSYSYTDCSKQSHAFVDIFLFLAIITSELVFHLSMDFHSNLLKKFPIKYP